MDPRRTLRGSDAVRAGRVTWGVLTRVALEYDGRDHAVDDRRGRDLDRREELRREGWEVIVVTARQVLGRPQWVVARVREALLARGWTPPS